MRCEACSVSLGLADVDAARAVGLCPRCGALVRAPGLLDPPPPIPGTIPGYRSAAPQPADPLATLTPDAGLAPSLDPDALAAPPLTASTGLAGLWQERNIEGGGVDLVIKSDRGDGYTTLLFGAISAIAGMGLLLLGLRHPQSKAALVACILLPFGVWLISRARRALAGGTRFRFTKGGIDYDSGGTVMQFSVDEIASFRHVKDSSLIGDTVVHQYALELVAGTQVHRTRVSFSGERTAASVVERLNGLREAARRSVRSTAPVR